MGRSAKAKGKQRARTEDIDEAEGQVAAGNVPSEAVFATWRKGDDDMEPSTKMLGLVDLLNEWDSTGDKAICYSQCTLPNTPSLAVEYNSCGFHRDVHVGLG